MNALPYAFLNGEFLPIEEARISPLDRGFLFGDAVYEVVPVYAGKPFLLDAHIERMERSLDALQIASPMTRAEWTDIVNKLAEKNERDDVAIYLQVSRGADKGRDHRIPKDLEPTVFGMASELAARDYSAGVDAITRPDNRWGRCDIKATALLANVLTRQEAQDAGAAETILVWDGQITEGATSSVIVIEQGILYRRPNGTEILPGTTTAFVVDIARQQGVDCREEPISLDRLRGADEIWITAATRGLAPVVRLDGKPVGSGEPGPLWRKISAIFDAQRRGQDDG